MILNGSDEGRLRQAASDMRKAGFQVLTARFDMSDQAQVFAAFARFDARVKARTPMRRRGRPDEPAGTAIYLASAASDYVCGRSSMSTAA